MASTSKGKGGIKPPGWNKHSNKEQSRDQNRRARAAGKKEITAAKDEDEETYTNPLLSRSHYLHFINELVAENFAEAHKYLQAIVNHKLQCRIKQQLSKPLF